MRATITTLALILLYTSTTTIRPVHSSPIDEHFGPKTAPVCGTCNPDAAQNRCDITTSCNSTGTHFRCACRAGYKASTDGDIRRQFRIALPGLEHIVYVADDTPCATLCDDPYDGRAMMCREVPVYKGPGCVP
jgi:hypothetical protein